MESFVRHIRYGLRSLGSTPGFTAITILTLALGIGGNTAMFSVINTVLLKPLSYPNPERLVQLELSSPQGNGNIASIPKFNVWREQTQVFESVAAYDVSGPGINLTGGDHPEQVKGIHVSADYFRVFEAPMALGRAFNAEEDRPGGAAVAIISNGLWRSRFGSDRAIINRTIDLGGDPFIVVGVLDPGFASDPRSDIWLPLRPDPNSMDQAHYLRVTARLRPHVTLAEAQAAMGLAAVEFRRKFPDAPFMGPGASFTAVPFRDSVIGDVRIPLLILLGAVGFVLLIACANVTNLLLARATSREREVAIRIAMGAGRARIFRQLLVESLLLSLSGGVVGLALGYLGVNALLALNPNDIPRIAEQGPGVSLDWRVLVFTFTVATLTGIVFGLIPALIVSRPDLALTLKEGGVRTGSGIRRNKTRSALVVMEMAIALVLFVGAALLIRTFGALRSVNPGFDADNVLTMQMSLTGARFETAAAMDQLATGGQQRIESLPGVTAAAMTCCLPLDWGFALPFNIGGRAPTAGNYSGSAGWLPASPHYFDVFHIPLLSGRTFTDHDNGAADRIVVINEAMAKQFWPNGDSLGASITIGKGVGKDFEEPPRQVVGIVGNVLIGALSEPPHPIMYLPIAQVNDGLIALNNQHSPVQWVVRTKLPPFSLNAEIQRELRYASGGLPVAHVRSMQEVVRESVARNDFYMTLLSIFAGVALLLAAIGVYGVMAYVVQQRRQEIGIRMAIGATPQRVLWMVVAQAMQLALFGVILGVGLALGLTRYLSSLLYSVKPWDPITISLAAVFFSVVAMIATYLPARLASRIDPQRALRYE